MRSLTSRRRDAAALVNEVESLFAKVEKEFGDIQSGRGTLGGLTELYEIRTSASASPAPRSRARTSTASSSSSATTAGRWCCSTSGGLVTPCRAMYPHERSLVKKLADKPFVLLGVNSDRDKDKLRKRMKEEDHLAVVLERRGHQRPDLHRVQRPRLADALHHRPQRRDPPQVGRVPRRRGVGLGHRQARRGRAQRPGKAPEPAKSRGGQEGRRLNALLNHGQQSGEAASAALV